MTHHEHLTVLDRVLERLAENGFDGMADACRVLLNEAMKIERADVLQADPYERTIRGLRHVYATVGEAPPWEAASRYDDRRLRSPPTLGTQRDERGPRHCPTSERGEHFGRRISEIPHL